MECLKGPIWKEHRLSKRYQPLHWLFQGENYEEATQRVLDERMNQRVHKLAMSEAAKAVVKRLNALGLKKHSIHEQYQGPPKKIVPKVPSWKRLSLNNVQRWEKHYAPWDREYV